MSHFRGVSEDMVYVGPNLNVKFSGSSSWLSFLHKTLKLMKFIVNVKNYLSYENIDTDQWKSIPSWWIKLCL